MAYIAVLKVRSLQWRAFLNFKWLAFEYISPESIQNTLTPYFMMQGAL